MAKSALKDPNFISNVDQAGTFITNQVRERQERNKPKTGVDYLRQAPRETKVGNAIGALGAPQTGQFVSDLTGVLDKTKLENKNIDATTVGGQDMGIYGREVAESGKGFKAATSGVRALGATANKLGPFGKVAGLGINSVANLGDMVYGHFNTGTERKLVKEDNRISSVKANIGGNQANQFAQDQWLVSKKGGTLRINKYKCGKPKMKFLKGGVIPMFSKGSVILGGQRHHEGNPVHGKGNPGIDPSTGEKQFETEKGELLLNIQQTEMLNQAVSQGDSYGIGVVMAEILSNTIDNSGEYAKS